MNRRRGQPLQVGIPSVRAPGRSVTMAPMTSVLHKLATRALCAVTVAAFTLPLPAFAQHEHGAPAAASRATLAKVAPPKGAVGPLPPLPRVPFAPARPMPVVQEVFEFAARHPEVLAYVPCYCGCEQLGHQGNHDCFVKSRAASGSVTEWEAHGIGCAICIDVGREAMLLFNSVRSEERRVGKECSLPCRSRWSPYH